MSSDTKRLLLKRMSPSRKVWATGYARCLIKRRKTQTATLKAFWEAWSGKLQLQFDDSRLVEKDRLINSLGEQLLFQQASGKTPISRAWFRVDFNPDGDIVGFSNRCVTKRAVLDSSGKTAQLTVKQAVTQASTLLNGPLSSGMTRKRRERTRKKSMTTRRRRVQLIEDPRLVHYRDGNRVLLCWRIPCELSSPREKSNVYVNALTGKIVLHESLVHFRSGSGRVFVPNPMVALNQPSLASNAPIPLAAYQEVELRELNNSGFIDGKFVSTSQTPNRVQIANGDFRALLSGSTGFYEVMAYYHIDAAQRYIRQRVTSNRFPEQVLVNARTHVYGESAFDFQTKILHLFGGGPRDGEDAEVIIHEFGHALHAAIAPGFGQSGYSKAISEGFADYLAATSFGNSKTSGFDVGIASWHARGSGDTASPPFLRRLDFAGQFSTTSKRLIEIWASCLWELRAKFGPHRADAIAILALHIYDPHLNSLNTFFDAALAIRRVNDQVYNDGNDIIDEIFRRHGIFA
jgi:hypothetical protein